MSDLRRDYIVQFDCAEAILAESMTREECLDLRDDFDCAPVEIIPMSEVYVTDAWVKNGWMRVNYQRR